MWKITDYYCITKSNNICRRVNSCPRVAYSPIIATYINAYNNSCTLCYRFAYTVTSSSQYTGVSKALYGHMLLFVYICLCVTLYTDTTCSSNSVTALTSSCQYTGASKALYEHMLVCIYTCLCVTLYTDMTCSSNS